MSTFTLPNVPAEDFRAELFRKRSSNAVLADAVDLNLPLINELGKPTRISPHFSAKTQSIIIEFPGNWWTTNMVRADGQSAFICRVKARLGEQKPKQDDYAKYVEWCHASLIVAALDQPGGIPKD